MNIKLIIGGVAAVFCAGVLYLVFSGGPEGIELPDLDGFTKEEQTIQADYLVKYPGQETLVRTYTLVARQVRTLELADGTVWAFIDRDLVTGKEQAYADMDNDGVFQAVGLMPDVRGFTQTEVFKRDMFPEIPGDDTLEIHLVKGQKVMGLFTFENGRVWAYMVRDPKANTESGYLDADNDGVFEQEGVNGKVVLSAYGFVPK